MDYIAHFKENSDEEQLLKDHLLLVAKLCGNFGENLGLYNCCYLAGLLHDMGKYSDKFQRYIRLAKENSDKAVRGSVDHSTAGGKLIAELCAKDSRNQYKQVVAELVGNSIISHHSSLGLQNFVNPGDNYKKTSDYLYRVNEKLEQEKFLEDYEQAKVRCFEDLCSFVKLENLLEQAANEIKKLLINKPKQADMFFIAKFIYSCLIDADRTNTRIFEESSDEDGMNNTSDLLNHYYQIFEKYNQNFAKMKQTVINQLRVQMSNQCFEFSTK